MFPMEQGTQRKVLFLLNSFNIFNVLGVLWPLRMEDHWPIFLFTFAYKFFYGIISLIFPISGMTVDDESEGPLPLIAKSVELVKYLF